MKLLYIFLFIGFAFSQSQYDQTSAVINSGGGAAESNSYKLYANVATSIATNNATSKSYSFKNGFINTILNKITILPPPLETVESGSSFTLQITITSNTEINSVLIYYRRGGELVFNTSVMTKSTANDSIYTNEFSNRNITPEGFEYYILATDVRGNQTRFPSGNSFYSQTVNIAQQDGIETPSGKEQNTYRIFSFPFDLDNKSVTHQLEDDLGSFDKKNWRLFDASHSEYAPNKNWTFEPGKAYWLITKDKKQIDCEEGISIKTNQLKTIILNQGWNLIGNPFAFNIPITHMEVSDSAGVPTFRGYEGSDEWTNPDTLESYKGYAIFSNSNNNILTIQPDLSAQALSTKKESVSPEWQIEITAETESNYKDSKNYLGIIENALNEWDNFDKPEPPTISNLISVYFKRDNWLKATNKYETDYRPKNGSDGYEWALSVEINVSEKISLHFDNIERLPLDYEAWAVDQSNRIAYNLRKSNNIEFVGSKNSSKEFLFFTGTNSFMNEKVEQYSLIPEIYELFQNFPNPFNPLTTIKFGLSQPSLVSLSIYNIMGQKIITLINNKSMEDGYHASVWNGHNQKGIEVASGIYLYMLKTNNGIFCKRMLLLK